MFLQHYCLSLGGHLARIESETEKNLIRDELKHLSGKLFSVMNTIELGHKALTNLSGPQFQGDLISAITVSLVEFHQDC